MKILALEKEVPGITDEQFTGKLLKAEARKAWELYQSGILRELYFTADTHEAVLMLECDSADEAPRKLAELPLVKAGLIDFRIMPLIAYPGFERLFGNSSEGEPESEKDWKRDDLEMARKVWGALSPQAKQVYILLLESENGMTPGELAAKLNADVNKILGAFGSPALLCKSHDRQRIERRRSNGRYFIPPETKELFRQLARDDASQNSD